MVAGNLSGEPRLGVPDPAAGSALGTHKTPLTYVPYQRRKNANKAWTTPPRSVSAMASASPSGNTTPTRGSAHAAPLMLDAPEVKEVPKSPPPGGSPVPRQRLLIPAQMSSAEPSASAALPRTRSASMSAPARQAFASSSSPPPLRRLAAGGAAPRSPAAPSSPQGSHSPTATPPRTPDRAPSLRSVPSNTAAPTAHPHSFAARAPRQDVALQASSGPAVGTSLAEPRTAHPARASYPSGYQPRGMDRNRTSEFVRRRMEYRQHADLEDQRMERRLGKLLAACDEADAQAVAPGAPPAAWWPSGDRIWGWLPTPSGSAQQQRRRAAEQSVVKWQSDADHHQCAICGVPFSLAVRRHHCRLCGRIVCSSPPLPPLLQAAELVRAGPCSELLTPSGTSGVLRSLPPRPPPDADGQVSQAFAKAERRAIRFCRDCCRIVSRLQYAKQGSDTIKMVQQYEEMQRDISEALPGFHELLLGLRYVRLADGRNHDADTALASSARDSQTMQAVAANARKELLRRFADYDAAARRLAALPPLVDGMWNPTQQRLQQAIFASAAAFLQTHSVPTQGKPARADKALTDQLRVLAEQDRLLETYLLAAKRERKLEDVAALQANRAEIQEEMSRLSASVQ